MAGSTWYRQLLAAQPDRLANGLGPNGLSPTWSPDGRRLAWAHLDGRGTTCYAHLNLGRLLLGLDPSRPGQQTQCLRHGDIYLGEVMYQHMRDQAQLTNSAADDESPSWSPDGTEIAYASGSQNAALMAIDVKTRKERLIYRPKHGAVTFVAWAPR